MADTPEVSVPFTVKELCDRLENRLDKRFDKQDATLKDVQVDLKNMSATVATKDDIREVRTDMTRGFREAHERMDGIERRFDKRISPLESDDAAEKAVEANRNRVRAVVTWGAGIIGTLAIVASVIVTIVLR